MVKRHKHYLQTGAILLFITGIVASCQYKLPAMAAGNPEDRLHSMGKIECEDAVMDTTDLETICQYISEKQSAVVDILLQLGTKFRQDEEGIHPDRNPDNEQGSVDSSMFDWDVLIRAVEESQTVPAGLPVLYPEYAVGINGVEERTDTYETAVADNISRGKAAWAEGTLLLGNGADNDRAHQDGVKDGENNTLREGWHPVYEVKNAFWVVRHVHIGTEEKKNGTNGCYHNYSEVKEEVKKCTRSLVKTEPSWHPDENNPEGGTWHGGYYTCPNHGGAYSSSGTCNHKSVEKTTIWHHDIACGLTDVAYGVLHIHGTDTDYYDGTILLEAELEPGEGYEQFAWQEGDELLWTDEEGNMLGIGPQLTVNSPGIYQCCINAANSDIDIKSGSVQVRIAGLVVSIE